MQAPPEAQVIWLPQEDTSAIVLGPPPDIPSASADPQPTIDAAVSVDVGSETHLVLDLVLLPLLLDCHAALIDCPRTLRVVRVPVGAANRAPHVAQDARHGLICVCLTLRSLRVRIRERAHESAHEAIPRRARHRAAPDARLRSRRLRRGRGLLRHLVVALRNLRRERLGRHVDPLRLKRRDLLLEPGCH